MKLYSYFRSSAAYRLRIALKLKGLDYDYVAVNLLAGEHKGSAYLGKNPQGLVPALELDSGDIIGQSLAQLEWLEETHPLPPLLPADALQRAQVRAMVNSITCDTHPLCNIAVLNYLREQHQASEDDIKHWFTTWMHRSFCAIEPVLAANNSRCAFGDSPGMADLVLVPQVYNARRFDIPLQAFPHLTRVVDYCNSLPAFIAAAPQQQPDSTL